MNIAQSSLLHSCSLLSCKKKSSYNHYAEMGIRGWRYRQHCCTFDWHSWNAPIQVNLTASHVPVLIMTAIQGICRLDDTWQRWTDLTLRLLMSYIYIYMELLVKPEMLTSYIYGPTFGKAETVSFYFLHNVSTLNQCREVSCATFVCKHFAS